MSVGQTTNDPLPDTLGGEADFDSRLTGAGFFWKGHGAGDNHRLLVEAARRYNEVPRLEAENRRLVEKVSELQVEKPDLNPEEHWLKDMMIGDLQSD